MAVSYEPIKLARSNGMGMPRASRQGEAATQTFKLGVPCKLDASGNLVECAFGGAEIVFGVNYEPPHNLAVAATAQDLSEGTPINQASAVTTPVGAWIRDGKLGYYEANGSNVFSIMLKSGQVYTDALLIASTFYGLTKDGTSGFWYLDNTDTAGDNAVAVLLGVDPSSPNTVAAGARVYFQFKPALRYFS